MNDDAKNDSIDVRNNNMSNMSNIVSALNSLHITIRNDPQAVTD